MTINFNCGRIQRTMRDTLQFTYKNENNKKESRQQKSILIVGQAKRYDKMS